jgi:hypothetical protein
MRFETWLAEVLGNGGEGGGGGGHSVVVGWMNGCTHCCSGERVELRVLAGLARAGVCARAREGYHGDLGDMR